MLTGYTQREVAAKLLLTKEKVIEYLDEIYDTDRAYLASIAIKKLQTPSSGFDGKHTKDQCIEMMSSAHSEKY